MCEAIAKNQGGNQLFPIPLIPLQSSLVVYFEIHRNQSRMFGAKITEQLNCIAGPLNAKL
jgi:hypothetical protein